MTVLLDNKGKRKVGDALRKSIDADARLSVMSGLFSVYGYAALQKQFSKIDTLRLLIPSNNDGLALSDDKQPLKLTGITGDGGKYKLNFVASAKPIGPIKFEGGKQGTLQSPRYTTYEKLLSAKEVMELFN